MNSRTAKCLRGGLGVMGAVALCAEIQESRFDRSDGRRTRDVSLIVDTPPALAAEGANQTASLKGSPFAPDESLAEGLEGPASLFEEDIVPPNRSEAPLLQEEIRYQEQEEGTAPRTSGTDEEQTSTAPAGAMETVMIRESRLETDQLRSLEEALRDPEPPSLQDGGMYRRVVGKTELEVGLENWTDLFNLDANYTEKTPMVRLDFLRLKR